MPSHFSDIGFEIGSSDEIFQLARELPSGTPIIRTRVGDYVPWSVGGGPELWFQRNPELNLIGMNPHFDTEARTRARLISRQLDPAHPLDGGFHAWLDPAPIGPDGDPEVGATPLFVDVPDMRVHDGLVLPAEVDLAIAGFARELEVYATEADFRATGSRMATESLIPSGLFAVGGEPTAPARAEAILYGTVEATGERVNAATGRPFLWARLRTWGATIEIVADPALAPTPPVVGGIVGGTFWMSARIIAAAPEPPGGVLRALRARLPTRAGPQAAPRR